MKYANLIDLTLLRPDATFDDYRGLFKQAEKFQTYSVCVPSNMIIRATQSCSRKVCAVISFPFGNSDPRSKISESLVAIEYGANEIDVVASITELKSKVPRMYEHYLKKLIEKVKKVNKNIIIKIIIETDYLTDNEIAIATELCCEAGADFIKTSTGYALQKDDLDEKLRKVKIIKNVIDSRKILYPNENVKIKVSGGIKTFADIEKCIGVGADRIGMSSLPIK
jgi:deoxyribose-phosphate aldolase